MLNNLEIEVIFIHVPANLTFSGIMKLVSKTHLSIKLTEEGKNSNTCTHIQRNILMLKYNTNNCKYAYPDSAFRQFVLHVYWSFPHRLLAATSKFRFLSRSHALPQLLECSLLLLQQVFKPFDSLLSFDLLWVQRYRGVQFAWYCITCIGQLLN